MNAIFWNVRGISAAGRKPLIIDTLAKTHADVIGFQETKKEEFSPSYLKSLIGHRDFAWHHLPATGTAGGILVGVEQDVFEVISWSHLNVFCHL